MRISSKSRNAIAALTEMALSQTGEHITVAALSKRLNISKGYLEQVFSGLKRGGLVQSGQGAYGGYLLKRKPENITLYDILSLFELQLFESPEKAVEGMPPEFAGAVSELVFTRLSGAVCDTLKSVSLADIAQDVARRRESGNMYYI